MLTTDFYNIIDQEIDSLINVYSENTYMKKQNPTGKKSFGFLFWFLKRYLPNYNLRDLEEYVTEGNDDSSCDLIFENEDQVGEKVFYVVQAKWFSKSNIGRAKGLQKEMKSCLSDFRLILGGKKKSEYNVAFNFQYDKLIEHKKKNGKIKFVFLALCDVNIDSAEYSDDFISKLVYFELIDIHKLKEQYIELEYKKVKTHNPLETPYLPKANFDLTFKKEQVISIPAPFKANIFLVKPKEIFSLFDKYGYALFYKNIRNPLLSSTFNKQIQRTILENPVSFWYFNNGITAITDSIGDFHKDADNVSLRGIQIINGAQTVYSIYETYLKADSGLRRHIDEKALVTMRVLETGGEPFDLLVTKYTNSQNPINDRDFHSNDSIQQKLQSDFFRHTGIWFETRRGEFVKKHRNIKVITNEVFAQDYLAYHINDPLNAKNRKKDLFVSREQSSTGLYEIIFNKNTCYEDMLSAYMLKIFIENKRKWYKKEISKIENEDENNTLFDFQFLQYATYDILALFKVLLLHINNDNIGGINGKLQNYLEKQQHDKLNQYYDFIRDIISNDIKTRESSGNKGISYSALFKNKELYQSLKKKLEKSLDTENTLLKL